MKRFKKSISSLLIAAAIGAGSAAYQPQEAQAGILLLPIIVGYYILIDGIFVHQSGLLVLLGTDGTLDHDSLASAIATQYPALDSQAVNDLTDTIKSKALTTPADSDGKKAISLSQEEVSQALKASMIEQTQPELFSQIVAHLK